jgi:hypothetical protein
MPLKPKEMRVLYEDAGRFREDLAELSRPELMRDLEERFAADESARRRERVSFLNADRLEQAVLRRSLAARAAREDPPLARTVPQQVETETDLLINALSASDTWLISGDVESPVGRLKAAEDQVVRDVALLATLAAIRRDAPLAGQLKAILEIKKADRDRIASLEANRQ